MIELPKCSKCGEIIEGRPFYCRNCGEFKKDDDLQFRFNELDVETRSKLEVKFEKR